MPFLKLFLLPISLIYGIIVFTRNLFFDFGIFKEKKYSTPIISIGNLCAGGSGKSPHVEYIINLIKDKKKIAVLSRGYGRGTTGYKRVKKNSFVKDVGDEPLQIARKYPEIIVAVSENRNVAIQKLIHEECQLILLDDAFQHRWVKPGLNILLTTYDNLFINDHLLPFGNLRESPKRFQRADVIVVTKSPNPLLPLDEYRLKEQIAPLYHQKLFFSYLKYHEPKSVFSDKKVSLRSKKVILFTGIAHTQNLVDYIESHAEIVHHFKFRDHYNFKKKDIKKIIDFCNKIDSQEKLILTTEKDATRIGLFEFDFKNLSLAYLPIEVMFQGKNNFNDLILKYVEQNTVNNKVLVKQDSIST